MTKMDKNQQLIIWRNCCKPALQAVCNNLANIDPTDGLLSKTADDTLVGLIECIDSTIDCLTKKWEEEKEDEPISKTS